MNAFRTDLTSCAPPLLAEAGGAHGVSSLEIARASLVGRPSHLSGPLVPAVYVLVGVAKAGFGDHTRFVVERGRRPHW